MEHIKDFIGKVRPQIFLALCILGVIAYISIQENTVEVAVGCIAGVIALAKDVLQSDA